MALIPSVPIWLLLLLPLWTALLLLTFQSESVEALQSPLYGRVRCMRSTTRSNKVVSLEALPDDKQHHVQNRRSAMTSFGIAAMMTGLLLLDQNGDNSSAALAYYDTPIRKLHDNEPWKRNNN
jgi:hypothetical protein